MEKAWEYAFVIYMGEDEVEIFIASLWEKFDVERAFQSEIVLEQMEKFAEEKNRTNPRYQLKNWMIVYSEYVSWFNFLALVLKQKVLDKHPQKLSSVFITMAAVGLRVATELAAIRLLVMKGFEGQARLIARSAVENLDLMLVAPRDRKITSEFVRLNSNDFWHLHVRKGRLRKKANKIIDAHGIYDKSWQFYREAEDALQSEHSHPSRWTGIFSIFPDSEGYDDWPAHWGRRTNASARTLSYLCSACDHFLLINNFVPFGRHRGQPALIQRDFDDLTHHQIVGGRQVITQLRPYLVEKIDTDLFRVPESELEPE